MFNRVYVNWYCDKIWLSHYYLVPKLRIGKDERDAVALGIFTYKMGGKVRVLPINFFSDLSSTPSSNIKINPRLPRKNGLPTNFFKII
jgi:hypothetical protein